MNSLTVCQDTSCERPVDKGGYCEMHYMRLWRAGTLPESPETAFRKASLAEKLRIGARRVASGCWEWQRGTDVKGYAVFRHEAKRHKAYRAAWQVHRGDIPDGAYVCHTCDNPLCVNPDHLFLGTHADNMADMRRKKRHARGETSPRAKLTEADVSEMRSLGASGWTNPDLSKRFGVSRSTVSSILARRYWKHVK